MKIRKDFVTNSSSSSYICEICGEEEYAWDIPYWMKICINDHHFCEDHLLENYENDKEDDFLIAEKSCPICNFEAYSQSELASYLLKTRKISEDEVFEEIKKTNKRRKKLYDSEYILYVLKKFDLTEDKIMDEIRNKFLNWHEFIRYKGE